MTACVNNQNEVKGGVSHKVLRSVVAGVLAVSMVPTTALAVESEGASADMLALADEATAWKNADVEFNGDYANGVYTVKEGEIFQPSSVKVNGKEIPAGGYEVIYFEEDTDSSFGDNDYVVDAVDSADGVTSGSAPVKKGNYYAVIIEKAAWDKFVETNKLTVNDGTYWTDAIWGSLPHFVQYFEVNTDTVALENVNPFEAELIASGTDTGKVDGDLISDESFQFTGGSLNVGFKMDGTALEIGKFSVACIDKPSGAGVDTTNLASKGYVTLKGSADTVAPAGDYVFTITPAAAGDTYSGVATVTVSVKAVDLKTAELTMKTVSATEAGSDTGIVLNSLVLDDESLISADGTAFVKDTVGLVATLATKDGVAQTANTDFTYSNKINKAGEYVFSVVGDGTNVKNSGTVTLNVVDAMVKYQYAGSDITTVISGTNTVADGKNGIVVDPAYGQSFNKDLLSAKYSTNLQSPAYDKSCDFDVRIETLDGEEADASKPGVYKMTLTTPVFSFAKQSYAGDEEYYIVVKGSKNYAAADTFVTLGETYLNDDAFDAATVVKKGYTGSEFAPSVVSKLDGKTLVEGTDYSVSIEDEKGNAVESAVEPGKHTVVVKFADEKTEVKANFVIEKASITEVEPVASFYATPIDGSAVAPTFKGSVMDGDKKVQTFDLSSDEVTVSYYKVYWQDEEKDSTGTVTTKAGWYLVDGKALKQAELTESGVYVASVRILTTSEHFAGGEEVNATTKDTLVTTGAFFKVTETVAFTDVDANEWYAGPIYQARDLGYINGIQGTTLFAPNSDIERSQIAAILFNMAGGQPDETAGVSYPTRFSDVVADAWYAKAVSWATEMGVVNGYAGTDLFGTFDKATREQVAGMFYNYAKAMGKDVSVADEDAALAKVKDADTVSPWFKTAVAWAVENGVMGNGGYVSAQDNITRAEVAAMAVNYQPEALK